VLPVFVLAFAAVSLPGHGLAQTSVDSSSVSSQGFFPGIPAEPIGSSPLSESPSVLALEHRQPAQMTADDTAVVSAMNSDLAEKAKVAGFDLTGGGWEYEQIVCPALPDYLFLAFSHGSEDQGFTRFVAALDRNAPWVRVVPTVSGSTLPFGSAWSRSRCAMPR
jgi:hypothetical protein